MKKHITLSIRYLAAIALICAGVIHSFPAVWSKWEVFMQTNPSAHFQIGALGLILGIGNLILLVYSLYFEKK